MKAMYFGMVFLGGGLGAALRWLVNMWVPTTYTGFPWSTTLVNLFGCLLIGWLSTMLFEMDERYQLLLLVGFLGAFTTFSTYALELVRVGEATDWKIFWTYLLLSNAGGLLCVMVGRRLHLWI